MSNGFLIISKNITNDPNRFVIKSLDDIHDLKNKRIQPILDKSR